MKISELMISFIITFFLFLVVSSLVSYLWNLLVHGAGVIEWESSFRLALIFGFALPMTRYFEKKRDKNPG